MKNNKAVLGLALAMVAAATSAMPVMASAADEKTKVEYVGEYTDASKQYYEVSVPAKLLPGGTGVVKLEGIWTPAQTIKVIAPTHVTLTNNIDATSVKELAITFNDITKAGDVNKAISVKENISVAEISDALIGTWTGHIVYTVTAN